MTTEIIMLILISFALGFAVAAAIFRIVCNKLIKANYQFHKQEIKLVEENTHLVEYINFIYDSTNTIIAYINNRDGENFPKLEHFPYLSECEIINKSEEGIE